MKPNDVFADEVVVNWPMRSELFFVGAITMSGDVVSECIEPHVCDMRFIPWQLDAPGQSFSTDREISQTLFDETSYFVDAVVGFDRIRMIGVPLEKFFFVAREPKEIVFFFDIFGFRVVDFALVVVEFFGGVIGLTCHAVVTSIDVDFDVAGVVASLQKFSHTNFVTLFCGANEVADIDV